MLKDERGINTRGTGLGLNICKNLAEKMGGDVSVESEGVDQGTTFVINLRTEAKIHNGSYNEQISKNSIP